jgi:hypothetical protein
MGDLVLDAIAAGQLQAIGALIDPMVRAGEGRALAVIGIRRLVRVSDPAGGDRPSRDLYGALAPRPDDPQDPPAHAKLAELHLFKGHLRLLQEYREIRQRGFTVQQRRLS